MLPSLCLLEIHLFQTLEINGVNALHKSRVSEMKFNADITGKAADTDIINIFGFYFIESIKGLAKYFNR